ncbi:unnamed protein product [Sphagnum tenellum]
MSTALLPKTEYRHSTWHQFSPPVCISSSSSQISPTYNMTADRMRSHMHSSTCLQNSCYLAKYLNSSSMPNGYLTTISQSSNETVQDKFQEATKAVIYREKECIDREQTILKSSTGRNR